VTEDKCGEDEVEDGAGLVGGWASELFIEAMLENPAARPVKRKKKPLTIHRSAFSGFRNIQA